MTRANRQKGRTRRPDRNFRNERRAIQINARVNFRTDGRSPFGSPNITIKIDGRVQTKIKSRIAITRVQHGIGATRYLPREFFSSNEYRHISELSGKLAELLGAGAYVQRGERKADVDDFAAAVDWLMSEARRGQSIQRYKGLGEMNPEQLWDTTVNPETRRLMQVKVEDAIKADDIFTTLMGDQVEPRRDFIEKNALTVSNLDV